MDSAQKSLPINKLSYSSLTQLLRNPLIWKMKYVLGVYEGKMGVSGMIGRACHEALKFYYGGNPDVPCPADPILARAEAKELGLAYLTQFNDNYIDYGKTSSREQMLKGYIQAMDFYFAEEPEYHHILMIEEKMTAEITTDDGQVLPLPATGTPDVVAENKDGTVDIIDTKFVTSFTSYDEEDGVKIVQSQFMYHLLNAAKGIKAARMVFREIKRSKNMDGSPQVRDWVIPFDHEPYKIIFYNLYSDAVKFISNPNAVYLPNLSDNFDGEHAWLIYSQGLLSADMSDVEVMHKVRDVAYVSKKFVASKLESAENKNLLPEEKIKVRLAEFGIPVEPMETVTGSSVTQYRFKVSAGVRMSSIVKHKQDIALALEAKGEVRILAPILGTALVGVEVENKDRSFTKLTPEFLTENMGTMTLPIGIDVHNKGIFYPLNEMPHLLIAGSTGSGKSVLLHTIITALSFQMTPEQLKLVLIDPKRVELSAFAKLPHVQGGKSLYEYDEVVRVLMGLTDEMESRYRTLEAAKKRDIEHFNKSKKVESKKMPYIVVVIDELADLMIRSKMEEGKKEIAYASKTKGWLLKELVKRGGKLGFVYVLDEDADDQMREVSVYAGFDKSGLIDVLEGNDALDALKRPDANIELLVVRLAQMARAVGIHLVIATQRPSVDVITGLIKANFPTRIALTTSSPADSIVILGQLGAEKLSGKGDMLFMTPSARGIQRLQGFYL